MNHEKHDPQENFKIKTVVPFVTLVFFVVKEFPLKAR